MSEVRIFQDRLSSRYDVKYLKVVDANLATIYKKGELYVAEMAGRVFKTKEMVFTDSGDFMFDKISDYTFDILIWAFPELLKDWDDQVTDLIYEVAGILVMTRYKNIKSLKEAANIAAQIIATNVLGLRK